MTEREIVTPEGVALRFRVAEAGERLVAFLLDGVLLAVLTLLFVLATSLLARAVGDPGWIGAATYVFFFASRNVYFLWFELRWQGRTPGKRRRKLRVIDSEGGPLRAEAVLVRNLTREFELFLPLTVLLGREALWPGAPGWAQGAAGLWALLFGLLPLFNRWRLRAGDIAGGTMVVASPEARLLEDQAGEGGDAFTFTDAQLDAYGNYELQVLEEVLRRRKESGDARASAAVAEAVRKKIRWERPLPVAEIDRFLRDFYTALRRRLEHRMLLGRRKPDKHSS